MHYLLPVLILVALVVAIFLAVQFHFARNGRRAMVEQHRLEGSDEEPNTL